MERSQGSDGARVTRRELGRLAAGALAGALAVAAVSGEAESAAQEPPKSEAPMPETDARVALIEKSRGRPLTEEQRKAVLKNIQSTEEAWMRGRQFPVPDGTEPNFLFRPTSPRGRTPSAQRRAPKRERTHG